MDCYFCDRRVLARPKSVITRPLGVCKECHCATCYGHGIRDRRSARWVCIACDLDLLSRDVVLSNYESYTDYTYEHSPKTSGLTSVYKNLDSFLFHRPAWKEYESRFVRMQKNNEIMCEYIPEEIWQAQSEDIQLKLAAALFIAKFSKLSLEDWPAIFQRQANTGTPVNG